MNEYELQLKKEEAQLSLLECKIIESEKKIVQFKNTIDYNKPLRFVKSGSVWEIKWRGKDYIWTGKSDVNTKEIENVIKNQEAFDEFVEDGCITLASEVKRATPNYTIGVIDSSQEADHPEYGKIKSMMVLEDLLMRVKTDEFLLEQHEAQSIYEVNVFGETHTLTFLKPKIKKPEPPQPIIIKSGDTWVAEFKGVDYLCIVPDVVADHITNGVLETVLEKTSMIDSLLWKPISEIEITDRIAKLRPMVAVVGHNIKLLAVSNNRIFLEGVSCLGIKSNTLKLATVKNLQE